MSINNLDDIYIRVANIAKELKKIDEVGVTDTTADNLDFWAKELETLAEWSRDLANKVRNFNKL